MTIVLTPEQEAWIGERVALGQYPSVDDAVRQLLDERIAERDLETDDLAWAKPFVEEAREAVSRGATLTLDEYRRRTADRLARP